MRHYDGCWEAPTKLRVDNVSRSSIEQQMPIHLVGTYSVERSYVDSAKIKVTPTRSGVS